MSTMCMAFLYVAGDAMIEVERSIPTINHRFSSLRYMRAVKKFNPIQRGYITSRNMDYLLKLPDHLMVPVSLLKWLVDYTVPRSGGLFRKKNKRIYFTKNIADKVFGFQSDSFRYALGSNDPDVVSEVQAIYLEYVKEKDVPIHHLEGILLGIILKAFPARILRSSTHAGV